MDIYDIVEKIEREREREKTWRNYMKRTQSIQKRKSIS